MASGERNDVDNQPGGSGNMDFTDMETSLKLEKTRAKSNFTRFKNKMLFLVEGDGAGSSREVRDACETLDLKFEITLDVITRLSGLYMGNKDTDKARKVAQESDQLEEDYNTAYDAARHYLRSLHGENSSDSSEILTIDMRNKMNTGDESETEQRQETVDRQETSKKVGIVASSNATNDILSGKQTVLSTCTKTESGQIRLIHEPEQHGNAGGVTDVNSHDQHVQSSEHCGAKSEKSQATINAHAAPFEPTQSYMYTDSRSDVSIGNDMWRQLKRVQIPTFSGNKKNYQNWKAAFLSCIDSALATPEYKLLQLRQYLSGDALKVIDSLGHSATAYEAAKDRLDRKYGGKRRQIAIYLDELEHFRQIRPGNAQDIEEFADLLDIAMINLKEAGEEYELRDGSLYLKLQRKLPETMIANYRRWMFENDKEESVLTLRTWVLRESEYITVASETAHGFTGRIANDTPARAGHRHGNQRTFFGEASSGRNSPRRNSQKVNCQDCGKQHGIWNCRVFARRSVRDRWNLARRLQLCFRCLGENHQGDSCPRSRTCGLDGCEDQHHRLLHKQASGEQRAADNTEVKQAAIGKSNYSRSGARAGARAEQENLLNDRSSFLTEGNDQAQDTTMVAQSNIRPDFIGLRTVPVILINGARSLRVNALLDDASTKTYVNADVAAELDLRGRTERIKVNVLNGQVETFETKPIDVKLQSATGDVSMKVSAYTVNKVTGNMPVVDWNHYKDQWRHLRNIEFPSSPRRPIVDMLIGLDCADLLYAIEDRRRKPGEPIARLTPLGWTCIGSPGSYGGSIHQKNFAYTYFSRDQSEIEQVNRTLKKFWEIEEVSSQHDMPVVRLEEQMALKKVEKSITYDNQMYRVGIPWKSQDVVLKNNYQMALGRLENTDKRLMKSPDVASAYNQIIDQYIDEGYVKRIPQYAESTSKWYLPHFPILRPDKDTTKTRIVFDASAKYDGVSLNDAIYQGPKLQRNLFDVLLRFQRQPVAVVCDIAEMYLRIGIAAKEKPYHRFLWRGTDISRRPDIYEFDRVVFGVNSSPFQAQFILQHHAKKFQNEFPVAAETILKSTYMDDSMDSVATEEQGIELQRQLSNLLTKAGMHARKWLSNSPKVLGEIQIHDRKFEVDLDREGLPASKTLGVWWSADNDSFTFKENQPDESMLYIKRNFLRKIATLFDPIGLLAPYTVRAKLLLQEMWTAGLEWDEELSDPLISAARTWFGELTELTQLQIPRCLLEKGKAVDTVTLHTFVDASENAYGAVTYARYTYQDESVSTNIVAAKTQVAPSKALSIPRLELMAAVIGVRLSSKISSVMDLKMDQVVFWSDSVNVLWWVRGRSREFKPFVANRVGEIQSTTDPDQWRYVPTSVNPADILSRGMSAKELQDSDKWWRGPEFLKLPEDAWPARKIQDKPTGYDELKRSSRSQQENSELQPESVFVSVANGSVDFPLRPCNYSSWLRLRRVMAWINRFIDNCGKQKVNRTTGELQADELKRAERQLIQHAQMTEFAEEWKALFSRKPLPGNSKLLGLQPKLDDDGLMRSDGRLTHAEFLSYDVRFPIILPRRSWVTKLIIKAQYEKGNHATGTNHTLSALSSRFWIQSGREAIREWERECAECRRRKSMPSQQVMAPLPTSRLKMSLRAFTRCAVDFAGPFITVQGRGKRREKRYLCLFTCLATRAVHLEMAFGLDIDSFLNAFYRMSSRRGLPQELISDNGTNFKGADAKLRDLVSKLDNERTTQSIANKGVTWRFNPPLAPHFGGVHETMVKAAKRAMYAILGKADINDEELLTAITGAEGLINSRPLTYQSSSPADDTPLTPNHFIHGQVGGQFAPMSVDETDFNLRKRWRRIQELVRHFWTRWMQEWIPALNGRKKWFRTQRDVRIGDVMMILSPDTPRGSWPLGRVLDVYPGKDGHVRVAKLQVGQGTLTRPVNKLCPLELEL